MLVGRLLFYVRAGGMALGILLLAISPIQAQESDEGTLTVAVFGDGLTEGITVEASQTYGALIEQQLQAAGAQVQVINAGKGTDHTQLALGRIQLEVVAKRPDVVVFMLGTFDSFVDPGQVQARVPLSKFRENLTQMVRFLRDINVVPILMTAPPLGNFFPNSQPNIGYDREPYKSAGPNFLMDPYMEAVRKIAIDVKIPMVDNYAHWLTQAQEGQDLEAWLSDGFHPNAAGHQQIADLLFPKVQQELNPHFNDIFKAGEGDYHTYRIPSMIQSKEGVVLAFCEGRKSQSDHAENDIVLKRSFTSGRTWMSLQVVADAGEDCLNNPMAVLEETTGRIFLMYQKYPKGFHEKEVVEGYKGNVCRSYVIFSDDQGYTWSEPEEITKDVRRSKGATSIAGGPGVGIQLKLGEHKGRLVMPFNQGPYGEWRVYTVYSDKLGKNWKMGDLAPPIAQGHLNEVQMVELSDGKLMLNARGQGADKHRLIAYSDDGGESWSTPEADPSLPEPQCQASFIRLDPYHLMFSNPASTDSRTQGTVRVSKDDGKTWTRSRVIYEGSFGYSCLTRLKDGYVGLLFERDDYGKVTFARFPLKWVMGGE